MGRTQRGLATAYFVASFVLLSHEPMTPTRATVPTNASCRIVAYRQVFDMHIVWGPRVVDVLGMSKADADDWRLLCEQYNTAPRSRS